MLGQAGRTIASDNDESALDAHPNMFHIQQMNGWKKQLFAPDEAKQLTGNISGSICIDVFVLVLFVCIVPEHTGRHHRTQKVCIHIGMANVVKAKNNKYVAWFTTNDFLLFECFIRKSSWPTNAVCINMRLKLPFSVHCRTHRMSRWNVDYTCEINCKWNWLKCLEWIYLQWFNKWPSHQSHPISYCGIQQVCAERGIFRG